MDNRLYELFKSFRAMRFPAGPFRGCDLPENGGCVALAVRRWYGNEYNLFFLDQYVPSEYYMSSEEKDVLRYVERRDVDFSGFSFVRAVNEYTEYRLAFISIIRAPYGDGSNISSGLNLYHSLFNDFSKLKYITPAQLSLRDKMIKIRQIYCNRILPLLRSKNFGEDKRRDVDADFYGSFRACTVVIEDIDPESANTNFITRVFGKL